MSWRADPYVVPTLHSRWFSDILTNTGGTYYGRHYRSASIATSFACLGRVRDGFSGTVTISCTARLLTLTDYLPGTVKRRASNFPGACERTEEAGDSHGVPTLGSVEPISHSTSNGDLVPHGFRLSHFHYCPSSPYMGQAGTREELRGTDTFQAEKTIPPVRPEL